MVIVAKNQFHEIRRLKLEIAKLRETLGAQHGIIANDGVTSVRNGSWVVTIESVSTQDITSLEKELDRLKKKSTTAGYQGSASGYGNIATVSTTRTRQRARHKITKNGRAARGESGVGYSITDRMRENRKKQAKISQLQHRIEASMGVVIIKGVTEAGIPVTITARGIHADDGWALVERLKYIINGRGVFTDIGGKIELRSTEIFTTE